MYGKGLRLMVAKFDITNLLRLTVEEQSILDKAGQAADEVFNRSPLMTKEDYLHLVALQVLEKSSKLGQSVAKTAAAMKDRAIKDGDEFRAKAINKSKNTVGYMIREAIKDKQ